MKNEILRENQSRIVGCLVAVLILSVLLFGYQLTSRLIEKKNDETIERTLQSLTYTEEMAKEELGKLQPLADLHLSKASCGKLYRALAEISYMTGDEMQYNSYMAYALYYLEESGDGVSSAYLTNKYIGRLYANGCYDAAEHMLEELAKKTDISALPLGLQAEYYLSRADIACMMEKDNAEFLSLARAAISLMPEEGERALNQAKADILEARNNIEKGNFKKAEALMSGYSENDNFGFGENQVYVVCDFKIPFYEISAKLALENGDADGLKKYTELYMEYCGEYSFRTMELRLLRYIAEKAPEHEEIPAAEYLELEKQSAYENLGDMTEKYGEFLLVDMNTSMEAVSLRSESKELTKTWFAAAAVTVYAAIFLFCAANVFISYMSKDGLTQLQRRLLSPQAGKRLLPTAVRLE